MSTLINLLSSITTYTIITLFAVSEALNCYQCGSEAIFIDYDYPSNSIPPPKSRMDQLENTALTLESCSSLEYSSFASWGLFSVNCGPEQICVKTVTDNGFDSKGRHHYVTASRGCSMRNDSLGQIHRLGCGIMKAKNVAPAEVAQKWDLMCFCDSDYCNGSGVMGYSPIGLIMLIIFATAINLKDVFIS